MSWGFDPDNYSDEYLSMGYAEEARALTSPPPEVVRKFPIGFHVSAPGPSKPEKPVYRVKAGSRQVPD